MKSRVGADKGVLENIFSVMAIADSQGKETQQGGTVSIDETLEGAAVSLLSSRGELLTG